MDAPVTHRSRRVPRRPGTTRPRRHAAALAAALVLASGAASGCGSEPAPSVQANAASTVTVGATVAPVGSAPVPTVGVPGTTAGSVVPTAPGTVAPAPKGGVSPSAPSSTTAPTTAAPAAPAQHAVATTSLTLVDTSRPTVSFGATIAGSRSLPTTVYYPTDGGGPFPLVVFAHGFEIGPAPYAHLCETIAAAGYVVAAPSFPLTDKNAAGSHLDRGDLPNQAGDVSFVADSVAAAGAPLRGVVDATRLGVVGHSDGADTALDIGYYPGRADSRVRAVVAYAPDAMTGPGGSVGQGTPLLLEHGDRDSIVPYSNSQTVWKQVGARRYFLTMLGANHLPPVQGATPWAPVLERVTVDFLDRYVGGRTTSDAAISADGSVPGTAKVDVAG